jgi:DNA-binding transcriptional LysR family regulator
VQAADLGSFTLAAKRLKLSPSALSRRISQLEDTVGVRLFHRTTRAVRLSEEGRAFFERAREALRELNEAQDATARLRDRPAGLLRVEAPTIVGRYVLVPALPRFLARYPEVQVELALRDYATDLVSDGIDVGFRMGPLEDSGLVGRRIGRTRMRVCGAPSYLRHRGTPRSLSSLARHERLGFSMQGRVIPWRLRDDRGEREIVPSARLVVNDAAALIDLAVGGAGLVWICDFMVAHAMRAGRLTEVLEGAACAEHPIHVLSLPSRQVLPKVRVFVDFVTEELAKSVGRA